MRPKGPEKINRYSDLLRVRGQLDSLLDNEYEVQGTLKVFPSREFEISSKEDLDDIIGSINLYSSPFASMQGNVFVKKRNEH
jgi:hypothetical protein